MSEEHPTEHAKVNKLLEKLSERSEKVSLLLESSESFEKDIRSRKFYKPAQVVRRQDPTAERAGAPVEQTDTVISSSESFKDEVLKGHSEEALRKSLWNLKK